MAVVVVVVVALILAVVRQIATITGLDVALREKPKGQRVTRRRIESANASHN